MSMSPVGFMERLHYCLDRLHTKVHTAQSGIQNTPTTLCHHFKIYLNHPMDLTALVFSSSSP